MFREDKKGAFVKKGIFWYRYHFQSGKFITVKGDNKEAYIALIKKQEDLPVVMNNSEIHTTWWMFQDKFYVEDEGYTAEQIKALVLEKQIRTEKRIQRAMLVVENKKITPDKKRDLIPDEVKMFVWRRDEGKCIKCGNQENLEFDHIIPISRGGSNTERNIQLLCEKCNREKRNNL